MSGADGIRDRARGTFLDKSDKGLLNSLMAPVIQHVVNPVWHGWLHGAQVPLANDWLGNPSLAIFAVVLPHPGICFQPAREYVAHHSSGFAQATRVEVHQRTVGPE